MIFVHQVPAALLAALFAMASFLLRGRRAAGIADGWFVTGLTLAAVTAYVDASGPPADFVRRLGRVLAALALVWLASSAVSRGTSAVRASVQAAASMWCWLAAHVCIALRSERGSAAAIDAVVLLLAALGASRVRSAAESGAYVLLPAFLLTQGIVPALDRAGAGTLSAGGAGLLLSALALAAVVGDGLRRWRRRRAVWLTQPERLTDEAAAPREFAVSTTLTGLLGGLLASPAPPTWLSALTLFIAGLAVLNVFHRYALPIAAPIGLALAGGATAHACGAIVCGWTQLDDSAVPRISGVVGLSVASLHLSWLAGFWRQQLRDGTPWTTAGRLIPAAQQLSGVAAAGAAAIGVAQAAAAWGGASLGPIQAIGGALLLLAAGRMLLTNLDETTPPGAWRRLSATAALLAGMTLIGAYFDQAFGVRGCAWLLIALLVLSWQQWQRFDPREPACANAAVFGMLPGVLLTALLISPAPTLGLWIPAAGAALFAAWQRRSA